MINAQASSIKGGLFGGGDPPQGYRVFALLSIAIASCAVAQSGDPIWMIGDRSIEFPQNGGGTISVSTLPTSFDPLIPDQFEYQGSVPLYTQNVQYDAQGNVLFFIVDGRIYNSRGLRLTDNEDDPNCEVCLWKGTNRIAVIPAPGSCTRYFIVAGEDRSDRTDQEHAFIQIGVLDLTLANQNPAYSAIVPAVTGRFSTYGEAAWTDLLGTAYTLMNLVDVSSSAPDPFIWEYQLPSSFSGPDHEVVRFDLIELGPNDARLMAIGSGTALNFIHFQDDGPHVISGQDKQNYPVTLGEDRSIRGEIEMVLVGNELRVAETNFNGQEDVPPYTHDLSVSYWRFNAVPLIGGSLNLPLLVAPLSYEVDSYIGTGPLDYAGNPITHARISGLEFSPNGQYIYFIKSSYSPNFDFNLGYIDSQLPPIDPLSVNELNIGGNVISRRLADSELEINIAPSGIGSAIYAIVAEQGPNYHLAALILPDSPDPTNWDLTPIPLPTIAVRSAIGPVEYRVLNSRVQNCTHLTFLQDPLTQCCEELSNGLDHSSVIPSGTATWAPGSNPFGNSSAPIIVNSELRFATGSSVSANNMEFRFGPLGTLVVEAGARFSATNCLFTSNCGPRWKGVRVNGTTGNLNQSSLSQGRLYLYNSEIRNAEIGVWTVTQTANGLSTSTGWGGRIHASSAIFRNNLIGVQIENYHRYVGANIPVPNLSYFSNCTFVTDNLWPDPAVNYPKYHALLRRVDRIRFSGCQFENEAYPLWNYSRWGYGIFAARATFTCFGYSDYTSHYFRNLNVGIHHASPAPIFTSIVDGMDFDNNVDGIRDYASHDAIITNNHFTTHYSTQVPTSVGLYLFQSEGYTVERNLFTKPVAALTPAVGVYFRGPAIQENRIYDNEFHGFNLSNAVEGKHGSGMLLNPPTGGSPQPGLQLLCNDYYDSKIDHALLQGFAYNNYTAIRNEQGFGGDPDKTANNRFFSSRPSAGPTWDIWGINFFPVQPGGTQHLLDIHYKYFSNFGNPELRPRWVHTVGPPQVALSFVDDFYELEPATSQSLFDKIDNCGLGELDNTGHTHSALLAQYTTKHAELSSAINAYWGNVDGGDKPDLLEALAFNDPWHNSYYLRDLMLANGPLSDEVMIAAINREEPLDPWHLTQLLLDNSKLSKYVWLELEQSAVLNSFFTSILEQFGTGISTRALFEQEIAMRSSEAARLQHQLIMGLAEDSTMVGRSDSLDAILAVDSEGPSLISRYLLALERGQYTYAAQIGQLFSAAPAAPGVMDFGELYHGVLGDWSTANAAQINSLFSLAYSEESYGSALAWGTLLSIGETDSLPPVHIPEEYKSTWVGPKGKGITEASLLASYPNPANDRVVITYPSGAETGVLECYDAQGKLIRSVSISGQKAFTEIELRDWSEGLYLVRLLFEGLQVGETKINVMH